MNPSAIEWTDATWNPVTGCSKVSQGCKNCYAERMFARPYPGRAFTDVRTHMDRLEQPLRMRKGRRIFVNSMSDLFHEDVPDTFIDQVFAVMGTARWHTFQVLTKRPRRMLEWFSEKWQAAPESTQRHQHEVMSKLMAEVGRKADPYKFNPNGEDRFEQVYEAMSELDFCTDPDKDHLYTDDGKSNLTAAGWPLPNLWLGVSVEDQTTADERIPLLLQTPAAVRFISAEPLLGPISFEGMFATDIPNDGTNALEELDLVIAGGESGPKARASHPDWFRSLRDQCAAAGTAFFFKQWGEWTEAAPEWRNDDGGHVQVEVGSALANEAFSKGDCLITETGMTFGDPDHIPPDVPCRLMQRLGKKASGRLLDGREHNELPI